MDRFPFNHVKGIQAAGWLLTQHPNHEMSYIRLLKLLYIADRECLGETGKPITGGRQVVMDHGPVHSRIYDMIKGSDVRSPEWLKCIGREGYQVKLLASPGVDRLTRFEMKKLGEILDRFKDRDDWDLVGYTHTFPEVNKNEPQKGSCKALPLEDVLEAVGLRDKVREIAQDASDAAAAAQGLRGA